MKEKGGAFRTLTSEKTSFYFGLVAHSLDSSFIRLPVVKMISLIYIINFFVGGCTSAPSYLIFSLAKTLLASYNREPQGSIVHFDVVSF